MNPGEIYLATFPFVGSAGAKLRPVLLLTGRIGPVPEILTAYISSVVPLTPLPSDIILDPSNPAHANFGLKVAPVVRLHKLATLHLRLFVRRLGNVSPPVNADITQRLRSMLQI